TTGFHAVHGDLSVFNVGMEQTNGIGTTTHTGNQCIRLTTKMLDTLTLHFTADYTLEITHQHRIWVRACGSANDVEGIVHMSHPVTHGFVHSVFQSFGTGSDRLHFRTQQLHAVNVQLLALYVGRAHKHLTLQAKTRRHCSRRHTVLTGTG